MLARAALARFQLDDNRRFVRPHAAADAHTDRWRARMPRAPQGVIPLHNLSTQNVGRAICPLPSVATAATAQIGIDATRALIAK